LREYQLAIAALMLMTCRPVIIDGVLVLVALRDIEEGELLFHGYQRPLNDKQCLHPVHMLQFDNRHANLTPLMTDPYSYAALREIKKGEPLVAPAHMERCYEHEKQQFQAMPGKGKYGVGLVAKVDLPPGTRIPSDRTLHPPVDCYRVPMAALLLLGLIDAGIAHNTWTAESEPFFWVVVPDGTCLHVLNFINHDSSNPNVMVILNENGQPLPQVATTCVVLKGHELFLNFRKAYGVRYCPDIDPRKYERFQGPIGVPGATEYPGFPERLPHGFIFRVRMPPNCLPLLAMCIGQKDGHVMAYLSDGTVALLVGRSCLPAEEEDQDAAESAFAGFHTMELFSENVHKKLPLFVD